MFPTSSRASFASYSRLGTLSRKGGASLALVHIYALSSMPSVASRRSGVPNYRLNVANAGHVQIVLSREGKVMPLTELHTTEDNAAERARVSRTGGFITPVSVFMPSYRPCITDLSNNQTGRALLPLCLAKMLLRVRKWLYQ